MIKFSAEKLPRLKQGDHDVIALYRRDESGEIGRVSTLILPEKIANEFIEMIERKEGHSE